jgi:hypothetical protein
VYQSERFGDFTYTLPNLTPNANYTVYLHFAEIFFNAVGQREFNVLINGTQVLTNFDIFAATGGENMAIVKTFSATASSSGTISVQFTTGAANFPKVSGIEIVPGTDPNVGIINGGIYTLVSQASGLLLDNEGSTVARNSVRQWAPGGGNSNQQWQINNLGNGTYSLVSLSSGMALDNGGSTESGAAIMQNVYNPSSANQKWKITNVGDGDYRLVVASSGDALDNGGSTQNGGTVLQIPIAGDSNQEWKIVPVQIGAKTPFVSYEGEQGVLGGGATVVSLTAPPSTEFSSPQLEASGRAYVNLSGTGQSVSWTNNTGENITFLNLRYSIPDSPGGGGITSTLDLYVNGTFRQAVKVNSIQTWVYETSTDIDGMNQAPSSGNPHVFWDEAPFFVTGAAIAPGSTITLKQDAANTAAFYNIDVIDLEAPPASLTQPANSLSITTNCGAQANNMSFDSTSAIQSCIFQAQKTGQIVWIPQGTFYLNTPAGLTMTGITIEGAGMWYSTVYYNPPLPATTTNNVFLPVSSTLRDFTIDGNAVSNNTVGGNGGAINIKGNGWLVDSLWIRHEGAGVWADGSNGTVQNCRLNNTWADGVNLNNGNGGAGNNTAINLTARNNFVRGSGDDGVTINDATAGEEDSSVTLINNTVVAPWWADNIAVYGGQNDLVANNLAMDTVREYGIYVGIFGGIGAPLQSAQVQGNVVERAGGDAFNLHFASVGLGVSGPASDITNVIFRGNSVTNSLYDGIDVDLITAVPIVNNTVNSSNLNGFNIVQSAQGSASFLCDTAINTTPGESAFVDNAPSTNFAVSGSCNVGFIVP